MYYIVTKFSAVGGEKYNGLRYDWSGVWGRFKAI